MEKLFVNTEMDRLLLKYVLLKDNISDDKAAVPYGFMKDHNGFESKQDWFLK